MLRRGARAAAAPAAGGALDADGLFAPRAGADGAEGEAEGAEGEADADGAAEEGGPRGAPDARARALVVASANRDWSRIVRTPSREKKGFTRLELVRGGAPSAGFDRPRRAARAGARASCADAPTLRREQCTPHADIRRVTYTKHRSRTESPGPAGYRLARRVRLGDLWPFGSAARTEIVARAAGPAEGGDLGRRARGRRRPADPPMIDEARDALALRAQRRP